MSKHTIKLANQFYNNGDLIPIIGAGCSMPFGSPGWAELIEEISNEMIENEGLRESIKFYLDKGDYWEAIKSTKDFGNLNEDDIKQLITTKIESIKIDFTVDNNLKDLALMDFKIYLTTNYDHFLSEYIQTNKVATCLSQFDSNTQNLYKKESKQIFHLHGHISSPGTIIITRESYEKLYTDEKYQKMFDLLGGSKAFMFIGMSFDDQFMRTILERHVNVFKSKSFILLDKSDKSKFNELKDKYNIEIIEYDASKHGHVIAIRNILKEISANQIIIEKSGMESTEVIGAILDKKRLNKIETNLFCEKLKLENIEELTINLCKLYFIAAEEYVASLKKHVISKDILGKILFLVFTKYQEIFITEYKKNKSSQLFLEKVHEVLKQIDFSRFATNLEKGYDMLDIEQSGLIHILADDPEESVWWGDERPKGDVINE